MLSYSVVFIKKDSWEISGKFTNFVKEYLLLY